MIDQNTQPHSYTNQLERRYQIEKEIDAERTKLLHAEIATQSRIRQQLEERCLDLKMELQSANAEFERKQGQMEAHSSTLRARIEVLEHSLARAEQHIAQANDAYEKLNHMFSTANIAANTAEKKHTAEVFSLTQSIQEKEQEFNQARARLSTIQSQLKNETASLRKKLQTILSETQKRDRDQANQITDLKNNLHSANLKYRSVTTAHAVTKENLYQLSKKINRSSSRRRWRKIIFFITNKFFAQKPVRATLSTASNASHKAGDSLRNQHLLEEQLGNADLTANKRPSQNHGNQNLHLDTPDAESGQKTDYLIIGERKEVTPYQLFDIKTNAKGNFQITQTNEGLNIITQLGDLNHEYIYSEKLLVFSSSSVAVNILFPINSDATLTLVLIFLDSNRSRLSHQFINPNEWTQVDLPDNCSFIKCGLRAQGKMSTFLNSLIIESTVQSMIGDSQPRGEQRAKDRTLKSSEIKDHEELKNEADHFDEFPMTLMQTLKRYPEKFDQKEKFTLAQIAYRINPDIALAHRFIELAEECGEYLTACNAIIDFEKTIREGDKENSKKLGKLKSSASYLLSALKDLEPRKARQISYVPNRICYILHNSLPYSSGGYATRSHGMASGLREAGFEVLSMTRPGFPVDTVKELVESEIPQEDLIDGIRYLRTTSPLRTSLKFTEYTAAAAEVLQDKFRELKPEFVMAASNYVNALPALLAARSLGIPFFYEVRGLWEITKSSREPEYSKVAHFGASKMLEGIICQEAHHVFTLTEAMREEIISRGANRATIDLLPNSCDLSKFKPTKADNVLRAQLNFPNSVPVIGYVGSFVDYEGLEDLVKACGQVKRRGIDFRLLLVGNENTSGSGAGAISAKISEIVDEEELGEWICMPGRVPYEEVERYYSLLDICPFPRKPWPVCEMVSPMKPLEALAMEKAVVVSGVRALAEIIEHESTGLVFEKGNIQSLADALERLIQDPNLRRRLGNNGRKWVADMRTWQKTGRLATEIIASLQLGGRNEEL